MNAAASLWNLDLDLQWGDRKNGHQDAEENAQEFDLVYAGQSHTQAKSIQRKRALIHDFETLTELIKSHDSPDGSPGSSNDLP